MTSNQLHIQVLIKNSSQSPSTTTQPDYISIISPLPSPPPKILPTSALTPLSKYQPIPSSTIYNSQPTSISNTEPTLLSTSQYTPLPIFTLNPSLTPILKLLPYLESN